MTAAAPALPAGEAAARRHVDHRRLHVELPGVGHLPQVEAFDK
ncbi:hypothetical protein [Sorangium cellulosum]|nr:hypothetical protein [Sorangium cellulosum]